MKHIFFFFFVLSTTFPAAPVAADQLSQEFPNYFASIPQDEALNLIDLSLKSLIERFHAPYVLEGEIHHQRFFHRLNQVAQTNAPGCTVYISGETIRNFLAYIYKKLYAKHTNSIESDSSGDDDLPAHPETIADYTRRLLNQVARKDKARFTTNILGINSDLEILIDFPVGTPQGIKDQTIREVRDFCNKASGYLSSPPTSPIRKLIAPQAIIAQYDVRIAQEIAKGGEALDWLAFPIAGGGGMRIPLTHPNIMQEFVRGFLPYYNSAPIAGRVPDSKAVEAVGILLQIPFLKFDPAGINLAEAALQNIIGSNGYMGVRDEVLKLEQKARFSGAHNRLERNLDGSNIPNLTKQLARIAGIPRERLIFELVAPRPSNPVALPYPLMTIADFRRLYTDNGVLYHGTKDPLNFLSMFRNGFRASSYQQGRAVYGYGLYSTRDRNLSDKSYATSSGIVLSFTVKDSARIIDMNVRAAEIDYDTWIAGKTAANGAFKDYSWGDHFKEYAEEKDIDIIIATNTDTRYHHVLIQNTGVIKLTEKDLRTFLSQERKALLRQPAVLMGNGWQNLSQINEKLSSDRLALSPIDRADVDIVMGDILYRDFTNHRLPVFGNFLENAEKSPDAAYLFEKVIEDISAKNANLGTQQYARDLRNRLKTKFEDMMRSKKGGVALVATAAAGIRNPNPNIQTETRNFFIPLIIAGLRNLDTQRYASAIYHALATDAEVVRQIVAAGVDGLVVQVVNLAPLQKQVDFLVHWLAYGLLLDNQVPQHYLNQVIESSQYYAQNPGVIDLNTFNFSFTPPAPRAGIGIIPPLTSAPEIERQIEFLIMWLYKGLLDDARTSDVTMKREITEKSLRYVRDEIRVDQFE